MSVNDTDVDVNIGASGSYQSVVQGAVKDFGGLWKTMGLGNAAGLAVAGGLAAAAAGLAVAVKQAATFQAGLTTLVTGAGESEKNLKMVGQGIQSVAISTGTTTKALTDGMYQIESAGFHGAAGLSVLKVAAEGAKVGNADLNTAAAAVTTVMHDYGISANNAGQAMNFIVSTTANGKMHMDDLTSSMGKILPTASQLHVPLAQIGGAMSTMTDAGISADRSAMALNMTMLKLVTPGTAAVKALNEVGLSSTDLGTTLTKKGLLPALQELTDHVGKKFPAGSAQYLAALSNITGGVRGLTGTLATTGINMQTFLGNTQKIADATAGAGNKVIGWNQVQKDFNQQLAQFKETIQVAAQRIGAVLLPVLTVMLRIFTSLMDNKLGLVAIGLAVTAIGVALVRYFTSSLANSIGGVGTKLLGLRAPALGAAEAIGTEGGAGGIVGALGALGPAGILAGVALGGVTALTVSHWSEIKKGIDDVGKSIGNILGGGAPAAPTNLTPKQSQAGATAAAPGVKAQQADQTGLLKTLATQTGELAKAKQALATSTSNYNASVEKEMADYAKYGPNNKHVKDDLADMSRLSGLQADAQNKANDAQNKVADTTKKLDANTAALTKSQGGLLMLINQLPAAHTAVKQATDRHSDSVINVNNKQKDLSASFVLFHGTTGPGAVDAHNRIQGAAKNLSGAYDDEHNRTKDVNKAHQDQAQAMQTARYWTDQHDQKIKALGLDSRTTKGYVDDLNRSLNNSAKPSGGFWQGVQKLFHFATGVTNFGGGMAMVGEQGPELVYLPPGSSVLPNSKTQQVLNSHSTDASTTNSQSISIQNLTIQAPSGATFQSIMKSINQDALNASKGLTVNGGAI